ncbi:MAG: ApaG domain, partial [Balneolaceae bacterium]
EDSNYETFEVQGEGVVGRQPVIQPADSHTDNSFCVLKSYRGSMRGHYTMQGPEGTEFHVKIPQFRLHSHLLT